MATTAKNKPVKKSAPKSSVETAKAATKVSANKTSAKVKSSKSSRERKTLTPLERVRSIHFSTVFAYVILGVISFFVLSTASASVLLNHQARDAFANADNVILGPASEFLFNVQYRYLFIAVLAVSAVVSLLLATSLRRRYESGVSAGISGFRWLLMGIVWALMLDFVSFLGGVNDLMTLKTVAALVVVASIFGWLSDRENADARTPKKLAHYASIFAYLLALFPLAGSLVGTTWFGDQRFGWNIYGLSAVILVGFVATLMNQRASIYNKAKLEYTAFEQRYLRIGQVATFLIVLIIFTSLSK